MIVIENILTEYKELFTIIFRHPAFELTYGYIDPVTHLPKSMIISTIFEKIRLEPDTATKEFFLNHSIDFRYKNTELTCFARTRSGNMYVEIKEPASVRFLVFANTEFLRRTNIVAAGSAEVYQLTNVGRTGGAGDRYISKQSTGVENDDLVPVSAVTPEQNCIAVIDISTGVNDAGYRLFNSGVLESPVFTLSFNQS